MTAHFLKALLQKMAGCGQMEKVATYYGKMEKAIRLVEVEVEAELRHSKCLHMLTQLSQEKLMWNTSTTTSR